MCRILLHLATAIILIAVSPAIYAQSPNKLTTSIGFDYSTGTYGGDIRTEIWFLPLQLKYETERTALKVTLPYVRIKGPAAVISIGDGPIVIDPDSQAPITTESGLGDISLAGSYTLVQGYRPWPLIDVTAKNKVSYGR